MAKRIKYVVQVNVWEYTFLQSNDKEPDDLDLVEVFDVAVDLPNLAEASALGAHTANVGRVLATPQPVPRQ